MDPKDLTYLFISLAVLLAVARLLGELAVALKQPSVLGEIAAGILLGPTLFGRFAPEWQGTLFPTEGVLALVQESIFTLAVVFFLLVAGLEVNLSLALKQGKTSILVALLGMLVPFALGFGVAWYFPGLLMEVEEGRRFVFALFLATALSITALPVVVKILKDLGLTQTDMGVIVVASAIVNDLVGWIIFAIVLGMIGVGKTALSLPMIILLTILFVVFMLTLGRWLVHRALLAAQAHFTWPAGVLSLSLALALLCAAFTEWLGIHAIFGAFIFGVALGDSLFLQRKTRATLDHFISFAFAPIFFASIGLKVDFISNFALVPVVVVLVLACAGKMIGCYAGGWLSGLTNRESLAIGAAQNARGAMEIILGLLALNYGVIDETLFVALVIMAIATSMISGTAVQAILKPNKSTRLKDHLVAGRIAWKLQSETRHGAIRAICETICKNDPKIDIEQIDKAVWAREQTFPTGLEHGVAVPHARIPGLKKPIVAVGRFEDGIEFYCHDNRPARLIFLILTPEDNPGAQLDILRAIGQTIKDAEFTYRLVAAESGTAFLALLNIGTAVGEEE